MDLSSNHLGMVRVIFRNANGEAVLAGPVFLPNIPAQGEPVSIRENRSDWREKTGVVARRSWYFLAEEPDATEVVIYVALDPKKR